MPKCGGKLSYKVAVVARNVVATTTKVVVVTKNVAALAGKLNEELMN